MTCCIVGLRTSLLLLFFLVFVQFSSLPYFEELHFSSKISQEPCKLECSYFSTHVDDDLLYCRILPCICPIFFPSIRSRMKFFVKDFSGTIQARVLIFGMLVKDDLVYCGIEN